MILKLILIIYTLLDFVCSENLNEEVELINKVIQIVVKLTEFQTRNATKLCTKHIQEYFKGLENQTDWAWQMLDASAKLPLGSLRGNQKNFGVYDECLAVEHPNKSFTGKHCLIQFEDRMTSVKFVKKIAEERAKTFLKFPKGFDKFKEDLFGICLPSTCSAGEIVKLLMEMDYEAMGSIPKFSIAERDCSTKEPRIIAKEDWIVMCVLLGFVLLVVLGTIYDFFSTINHNNGRSSSFLAPFSIIKNAKTLFSRAKTPGEIEFFYGIRALTMGWIVLSHATVITSYAAPINFFDAIKMMKEISAAPVMATCLGVDTFFFLSGFLVYYSFHKSLVRTGSFDAPLAYILRYIRLTPPFAVALAIQIFIFPYIGDGPRWKTVAEEASIECRKKWWQSIVYVENYMSPISECIPQSWYLSTDMQYYWISPIISYTLHYKPKLGSVLVTGLILASIVDCFFQVYTHSLGVNLVITNSLENQFHLEYARSDTRALSWLIGLGTSYLILVIEDKGLRIKLSKICTALGWLTAAALCLGSIYGIIAFSDSKYTSLESAYYVPLHRLGWVLGISWIVFACFFGYGGFVNALLSAGFLKPIGRLTYCVFLIHFTVQLYRLGSQRTNYYENIHTSAYFYYGDLVMSNLMAIPLSLIFEMPFCNLAKNVLKNAIILPLPRNRKVHVINDVIGDNESNEIELGRINRGFQCE